MVDAETVLQVRTKYESLASIMEEGGDAKVLGGYRSWRAWLGGISAVAQATGLSRNTIMSGIKEVQQRSLWPGSGDPPTRGRWTQAAHRH
jgi:hypothetical protein